MKSILLDIRMATPACFLGLFSWKTFFQPYTWGNVYLHCWGVFLVWSRMMTSVFASILLAYLFSFLLENWIHWYWEMLMTTDFYLLYFDVCGMCVCVCVCVFFFHWYGITSLGWSFPSSVFCKAGFVDRYCLNMGLSWNTFLSGLSQFYLFSLPL